MLLLYDPRFESVGPLCGLRFAAAVCAAVHQPAPTSTFHCPAPIPASPKTVQVRGLERGYPGGVRAYLHNAKALLRSSAAGDNPFEGMRPEVPSGVSLDYGTPDFVRLEEAGIGAFSDCAFVLVAGGLGERLGYEGIKVSDRASAEGMRRQAAIPAGYRSSGAAFQCAHARCRCRVTAPLTRPRACSPLAHLHLPAADLTARGEHHRALLP